MGFDLFKTLGLKSVEQTIQGVGHSIDQALRPIEQPLANLGIDALTGLPLALPGSGPSPAMSLAGSGSLISGEIASSQQSFSSLTSGLSSGFSTVAEALQQLPNGLAIGLENALDRERQTALADTANIALYVIIALVGLAALWALLAPSPETVIETAGKIAPALAES